MKLRQFFVHKTSAFYPIMTSILMFFWGLWLVLPLRVFETSATFSTMASIAPAWVWGIAAIAIAIGQILYVIKDGKFIIATILQFYFWAFIAICLGLSNWHSTGVIIYSWLALFTGFGWINRKVQDG